MVLDVFHLPFFCPATFTTTKVAWDMGRLFDNQINLNELKKASRRYYENIRDYVLVGERYSIPLRVIRELCDDIDLNGCV